MNGNIELLNYIFQNSEMGVNTLSQLIDISDDEDFKDQLRSQKNEYNAIYTEVKNKLYLSGEDEKGIGKLSEMKTYMMINMQTLTDKSTSHIAEMLIIGSNMGVIQAIKKLKDYKNADKDIIMLMDKLLKFEENNIQKLKQYL